MLVVQAAWAGGARAAPLTKAKTPEPAQANSAAAKPAGPKAETPEVRKGREAKPRPLAFGASTFPHPLDLGIGLARPNRSMAILSAGAFQRALKSGRGVRDIKVELRHIEFKYRRQPSAAQPLFLQLAGGYQELQVSGSRSVTLGQDDISVPIDFKGRMVIRSVYYTPKIGFTRAFGEGLQLSWSLGYMIPAYAQSEFDATITGDPTLDAVIKGLSGYRELEGDLERVGKRIGQFGLPVIDLFDLTYEF